MKAKLISAAIASSILLGLLGCASQKTPVEQRQEETQARRIDSVDDYPLSESVRDGYGL